MWDLPRPGIEPKSPALASGFFSTELPGKTWLDDITDSCLNGHEFEQTLGYSEGQGSLACCSPWDRKELDVT